MCPRAVFHCSDMHRSFKALASQTSGITDLARGGQDAWIEDQLSQLRAALAGKVDTQSLMALQAVLARKADTDDLRRLEAGVQSLAGSSSCQQGCL